jgi:hypothetical protein
MKKTLFFALAFLLISSAAWGQLLMQGTKIGRVGCPADQILAAHFENNDDVTAGTPAGCTNSATTTLTKTGTAAYSATQASDGTYSLYLAAATDKATIPTQDVRSAGTLIFDVYMASHVNWATLFHFYIDANNKIMLELTGTSGSMMMTYKGQGATPVTATTTGIAFGSWNTITLKWSVAGASGKYISIQHDSDTPVTSASVITVLSGTWPDLTLGDPAVTISKVGYYDKLILYNTWQ